MGLVLEPMPMEMAVDTEGVGGSSGLVRPTPASNTRAASTASGEEGQGSSTIVEGQAFTPPPDPKLAAKDALATCNHEVDLLMMEASNALGGVEVEVQACA